MPKKPSSRSAKKNPKLSIRPIDDRVVVRPVEPEDKTRGGIVLPDKAKKKTNRGRVEAIGNGRLLDAGARVPMQVKPGDEVLFTQYAGSDVELGEDKLLVLREQDILAVIG